MRRIAFRRLDRLSHGGPAWFVRGKRLFVSFADQHHGDRVACWCAVAPCAQEPLTRQRSSCR